MMTQKEPVPKDIYQLARDAEQLSSKQAEAAEDSGSEAHTSLTEGLDRVRGVAVERARKANVRLRKQAAGATVLSFGIGIALGLLFPRWRRKLGK